MEFCYSKVKKVVLFGLILGLVLIPLLFTLTSCQPVSKEDIINNLFPNLWVFLSNLIAAAVLIVVMTWLVWKPTKNILQKRHDFIAKQIEEAQAAKQTATIQLNEANQLKVDAYTKAMEIQTAAKKEAFDIIEKAKLEAKQTSDKIVADTQASIEKEKQRLKNKAQDRVIDIAFDVANSILVKEVKKKDQDKYIDELLDAIAKDIKKSK